MTATPPPSAPPSDAQRAVAAAVQRLGARAGDRVAVLATNSPAFVDLTLGCLRAGIVPVPLNVHLTEASLRALVRDADPAVVAASPRYAAVADERPLLLLDEGWTDAPRADLAAWPQARPMHYTSGTTGRSKGVWSGLLGTDGGRALCEEERALWGFDPADVHLVCSPLYHSAPHRFALNTLLYGGRLAVLEAFDAAAALRAIAAERVTTMFVVPTQLQRLLTHPAFGSTDLSSLRLVIHAGAPCPRPTKEAALDAFPPGSLWELYGSTEGQFTAIGPDEWRERPGSVGRARAGRRLRIVLDGREAFCGDVGTIWCSAPPFARFSYWRDPAKTADAWEGDLFTVGDLGALDPDGYLYLKGRRSDLILTGGVNVYPAEVEHVLLSHPAVTEGVVFGVPDAEWGERVCAAVVAGAGEVDPDELRAWLRERLAGFQTPKQVFVVDALPRNAGGKVVRHELAERLGAGSSHR